MTERAGNRLAWSIWVIATLTGGAGAVVGLLNRSTPVPAAFGRSIDADLGLLLAFAAFPTIGLLIATRHRSNAIGWLFLAAGAGVALWGVSRQVAIWGTIRSPGSVPGVRYLAWLQAWSAFIFALGPLLFVLLLFPSGTLPSRRWRVVAWALLVALVLIGCQFAFVPGPLDSLPSIRNAFGIASLRFLGRSNPGWLLFGAAALGAAAAVVIRFRRSRGEERAQMKWFAYAAAALGVVLVLFLGSPLANVLLPAAFLLIALATGAAILKYRLYDIDIVINKTVVFGALAAFITAVYVAIVVGIGAAVGSSNKPSLGLSILATAVVAVAFQPVRNRVQRFANRMVYGKRATPYEVLSTFSSQVGGTYATEDLLPRMARILGEGTGAREACVWLAVAGELRPEAAWPGEAELTEPVPLTNGQLPSLPGSTAYPVHHRGELLGALSLIKPPGERLAPAEEKLAADLASQAGLVLRNVRLTEELLGRLEELKASRQRLVRVQDEERRKLERNLHDGAQQQLVALAMKLRLARTMNAKEPTKAEEILVQVEQDAASALEDLRDLARGIYPPLLADQGLAAALLAQARKAAVPTTVETDEVSRYPQEVEAAVYFSVLEALQNVAKYAGATSAAVRLRQDDRSLTFEVTDDGRGFDTTATSYGTGLQGIVDRLSAIDGELTVDSRPGSGTTVRGYVPVAAADAADREAETARE